MMVGHADSSIGVLAVDILAYRTDCLRRNDQWICESLAWDTMDTKGLGKKLRRIRRAVG